MLRIESFPWLNRRAQHLFQVAARPCDACREGMHPDIAQGGRGTSRPVWLDTICIPAMILNRHLNGRQAGISGHIRGIDALVYFG